MGFFLVKGEARQDVGADQPVYDPLFRAWRVESGYVSDPEKSWRIEYDGASAALLPLVGPMAFYMAFTPAERVAISTSTDTLVADFWSMVQMSIQLGRSIDPNLGSVRKAVSYLAEPVDPGPGAGILAGPERVEQILLGIAQ